MAQFTHSLCEEVIRTDGKCGLTRNEMVQLANLALRVLKPAGVAVPEAFIPNVEGRDFYELCQEYRWSRVDPVPQFEALKEYIKTGKLPWPSFEQYEETRSPPRLFVCRGEGLTMRCPTQCEACKAYEVQP